MRNIGKISETVLKRSVLKPIKQNKLGITGASTGLDCAFFSNNGIATGYVAYENNRACEHAIIQACNNLWAKGVNPQAITLTISLPDSFREIKLKEIMKQACETSEKLGLKIINGHTEYVQSLLNPVISVTAVGEIARDFSTEKVLKEIGSLDKKELDIVMTKWMALSGTSILATQRKEELQKKLPAYYVEDAADLNQFVCVRDEAVIASASKDTVVMHDVAGGGIFTGIWEICDELNCGCSVELDKISVLQETIEVCEYFDINPYNLRGDGSLLIISSNGQKLVDELKSKEIMASIIGHTTDNMDRVITRDEETRFLEPGRSDELTKIIIRE